MLERKTVRTPGVRWPSVLVVVLLLGLLVMLWALWDRESTPEDPSVKTTSLQQPDPAIAQFEVWTRFGVPEGETSKFTLNVAYPKTLPPKITYPWESIEFDQKPQEYMQAVLTYCLEDAERLEFDFKGSARWFHTPWLPREPLRGLTTERRSEPGELAPTQTQRVPNYAVGYYNAPGGFTLGQVWADRANPDPKKGTFPVGTVSCKLLFTAATPTEVPYLQGSPLWRAAPNGVPTDLRLLQFDIAVRDARVDSMTGTGWVFGTFMVLNDSSPPASSVKYTDLTPVGLMWGNDPTLGPNRAIIGDKPTEGWMNPKVAKHFADVRRPLPSQDLGLFGRVNGPVDNPKSSCLSCHGRALDGGMSWTPTERAQKLPFVAPTIDQQHDADVRRFFRNLKPTEPFLSGPQYISLDYSLQLAVGLENFHAWRINNPGIQPTTAVFENPGAWILQVPEAEKPQRGDGNSSRP